jgi:hypothetical protein
MKRFDWILFLRNLDGTDLAVGLQNGTIWIFDVLGNGDFQLRTNGASQVKMKSIGNFF